ncbi:hypothetical protein GP2_070_00020 [Gordonia paraffinivorans NBRC 108238]|uniref:ATPase AAA-type core domain-containing protein n=2 Tax=Gordonia paraffinivorans TaxID=175628 RepID=A0ABQ0IRX9_9ACTN|nr:hypothetical protein GP2_070_00020 [Gordonia paraffinivorans NBRC 108238]
MSPKSAPKSHTMLVSFAAENVRSFRDRLDFSMEATAMAEPGMARAIPWRNEGRSLQKILPVAGVFGANASGKTTLLRAMADMRNFVRGSYAPQRGRSDNTLKTLRKPFRLDPHYEMHPSHFEIEVILDGVRHEYGFVVDDERVLREWARWYPRGKAALLFDREGMQLRMDRRGSKSRAIRELLREDALVLSIADAAGLELLEPLNRWFEENLLLCDAASRESRGGYTARLMENEDRRKQVLELLQVADLGITDAHRRQPPQEAVEFVETVIKALQSARKDQEDDDEDGVEIRAGDLHHIELSHRGTHGSVPFHISEESLGTVVWLGLVGPLLDALMGGHVLLVDELEASLHPLLVEQFVRLFQNRESNPHGAQLIFNSHEARLLGNSAEDRVIGRDQAWFAEKLPDGSTQLFSLVDLNPRKSEAIAKRYLAGRYGATPILSSTEFTALAALMTTDIPR